MSWRRGQLLCEIFFVASRKTSSKGNSCSKSSHSCFDNLKRCRRTPREPLLCCSRFTSKLSGLCSSSAWPRSLAIVFQCVAMACSMSFSLVLHVLWSQQTLRSSHNVGLLNTHFPRLVSC